MSVRLIEFALRFTSAAEIVVVLDRLLSTLEDKAERV